MNKIKKVLHVIFIEGLSGMTLGLFATLIIGTIMSQLGIFIGGTVGGYIETVSYVAQALTGMGIGVSVACKFKMPPMIVVSAGVCGWLGAMSKAFLAGDLIHITETGAKTIAAGIPGEPFGAFIAAMAAIGAGKLVSGKTQLDILATPIVSIASGAIIGILVGPPISTFMTWLGDLINIGVRSHPFFMGIIVAVVMGMVLTLPISSAALGVILGLNGIAAGAATVGCCTQMVGFAVASYRENKIGGLVAQGLGTSMLQVPNIMRHPLIWIPPTLASAVLGPVVTCIFGMTSNAVGSGMGTSGLIGPILGYQTMIADGFKSSTAITEIIVMYVILPAILTWILSEFMRKMNWIKKGDMKLCLQEERK
ncbi:MAG: PTS sugar transporter subunit IIC [Lachnoclostridium sp.]|jgi:uncharacterized membrane protein|nr:PTS sugar transporter subunit IIC [Lachnoclostridium sp.]